jgi:hypothetical protein
MSPVGPRLACSSEPVSDVEALFALADVTSNCSDIPAGGVIEVFALFPNNPTMSEPSTVVVTDGAAIKRVLGM